MRIGAVNLGHPVVLAPMAGVTDAPFRVLCAEAGGGLFVSEMLTARGLVEGADKSWRMASHHPSEATRSVQLYGSDPRAMGEAARRLADDAGVDHIDLNFGCPVPKITRNGGGAALPVRRRLFGQVVEAAVGGAGRIPVTVKMRMGLDDGRLTFLEAASIAADAGAAAVALHARTAVQGYSGVARWDAIGELRARLPADVPVLGNGDIWEATDAVRMMAETGCDGVVIGRGCLGRPWLFADLEQAMRGHAPLGPPPFGVVAATVRRHVELAVDWYDDETAAVRKLRKHLRWYLQGYPVGAEVRRRAGAVATVEDVHALVDEVDPDLTVLPEAVRAPRGRTDAITRLTLPHGWCEHPDAMARVEDDLVAHSGG
ncbi:tRNA dihydrouridine synthase DusB [Actinomarinicola tropica]|uniref:tRNA-dihydrouridine synthase n=2 Tax=Actinomarinicola tropica TaxID=2789776 RepID=A0A5Q2RGX7_9ACTN|nr:tRNA dihydrouridine synthase DusB [Actinomarinicola tropica]QGG94884.1 tRNA dihydrouridine synthase DusB [Actinomarinicola tropica]